VPRNENSDIGTAVIKEVSLAEARKIVKQFEPWPAITKLAYGIFISGRLAGCVVFGPEYCENLQSWDRYGFTGRILSLLRGVTLPWAPCNTASKLIRGAMRMLPPVYRVVTAMSDVMAGELGCIFSASGFDHVGQMYKGTRAQISYQGRVISERQARRKFGTSGRRQLAALGIRSVLVPRRSRYFAFRGDCREQEALRSTIAHLRKPYPKRAPAVATFETPARWVPAPGRRIGVPPLKNSVHLWEFSDEELCAPPVGEAEGAVTLRVCGHSADTNDSKTALAILPST
jgi:hypothetical protein